MEQTRTFEFSDGVKMVLKKMPPDDNEPFLDYKSRGWIIPTENCKEGDSIVLDGVKYVFRRKSSDGQSDIFENPNQI